MGQRGIFSVALNRNRKGGKLIFPTLKIVRKGALFRKLWKKSI
jgi:hypothetical protein